MGQRKIVAIVISAVLLAACQEKARGQKHDGAMVLAFSWQPAFCERAARKPECRSQEPGRYDANHFTLHGLWPQPGNNIYCGVSDQDVRTDKSGRWDRLAELSLTPALLVSLNRVMPGVMSQLHRHEWIKHGTCYAATPEVYYADSLALMDTINKSPVRQLFAANIGMRLDGDAIREAFDEAFGRGAGARLRISCKRDGNRELITELTLGIRGRISTPLDLNHLIEQSAVTKPGCPGGIVDRVGLQ